MLSPKHSSFSALFRLSRACRGKWWWSFFDSNTRNGGKKKGAFSAPSVPALAHAVAVDTGRPLVLPAETRLFLSFPYVCPKPVLVKWAFLYINGTKDAFPYRPIPTSVLSAIEISAICCCENRNENIALFFVSSSFPHRCPDPVLAKMDGFIIGLRTWHTH